MNSSNLAYRFGIETRTIQKHVQLISEKINWLVWYDKAGRIALTDESFRVLEYMELFIAKGYKLEVATNKAMILAYEERYGIYDKIHKTDLHLFSAPPYSKI